jgi:hypothetical protein
MHHVNNGDCLLEYDEVKVVSEAIDRLTNLHDAVDVGLTAVPGRLV